MVWEWDVHFLLPGLPYCGLLFLGARGNVNKHNNKYPTTLHTSGREISSLLCMVTENERERVR